MMNKFVATILMSGMILVGCNDSKTEKEVENNSSEPLALLEVTLEVPENINLNEEVILQAVVKQGNENVDDANDVKFEIRKVGSEEKEMLEAEHNGDGKYLVKKTFTENGNYMIISHVTARSMHSMPRKEIVIGNPAEEQDQEHGKGEESAEIDHHNHHSPEVEIIFNQDLAMTINEEVEFSSTVKNNGQPLLGARVKFEVIPDQGGKTVWLNANEETDGMYTAKVTFKSSGSYHVQIHVNKAEIHEHKMIMINVKE